MYVSILHFAGYMYGELVPLPRVTIQRGEPDLGMVRGGYCTFQKDVDIYVQALFRHRIRGF
jgi:hypothetical protein